MHHTRHVSELTQTLSPGEVVRIRQQRWSVVRHLTYGPTSVLEVLGLEASNSGQRTRFLLPFEPLHRVAVLRTPRVARAAAWRRVARRALAAAVPAVDSLRTIAAADIALLPFQLEPAIAVTRGLGSRLLLADDVGLGKTIQAALIIAEVLQRIPDGHVLIVSPAALREQWLAELARRFAVAAVVLDSPALGRLPAGRGANPWAAHQVVITSIDFVKRPEVIRSLEGLVWDLVVFDEAHALAGRSDRATAAGMIAERGRTVVLLSATPHSGDDGAFEKLCGTGDLHQEFPLLLFHRMRRDVGLGTPRHTRWLRVRPTPPEVEMHRALDSYASRVWHEAGPAGRAARLAMSVLVRRACSSAASLARSVERRLTLLESDGSSGRVQLELPFLDNTAEDDEPASVLMARGLRDARAERVALEHILLAARRAAENESKLRVLTRLLRRASQPAIVFTEYRDTLSQIAAALTETEGVVRLHGGLTRTERADAVRAFTTGAARLLLATDAASEGLNLHQQCRLVVNLELPWTPLRLEQRVGRVERIGQHKPVHAVHFVASGTAEEITVATLHRRLERIRSALGSFRLPALSEDDVSRAAIGGAAVPAAAPTEWQLPARVTVPDLRAAARGEADRAAVARRLRARQCEGDGIAVERPIITRLRRGAPGRYWVFTLGFAAADGQLLWNLLLALHHRAPRGISPDARAIAQTLDASPLAQVVHAHHLAARNAVQEALDLPLDLASRRERAIAKALAARTARLSATLLQPGLFDRRAERAAAAQAACAEEALARCAVRLERLDASRTIAMSTRALAFAAIVE